jgi:hypothetical protein
LAARAPFSEPVPLDLHVLPAAISMGAPNVTAACLLYVIVLLMDGHYTVYVATPT